MEVLMARMTNLHGNPNLIFGCHPVIKLNKQSSSTEDDATQPQFPSNRLTAACFLDGVNLWEARRPQRRKALDRVIARVKKKQLPGSNHQDNELRLWIGGILAGVSCLPPKSNIAEMEAD
jgi:hypothetical protein